MMLGWIQAERHWRRRSNASGFVHFQTCILYLFLSYVTFFGTGNTGSLSSFEISSTYRFVTVFNPFLMGFLLIVKIAIPFILVGVTFGFINWEHRVAEEKSFFIVLGLSNIMAFTFFFLIKDEGSWRDIGLSISHFVMSNAQILIFLIVFRLPRWLGITTMAKSGSNA
jgi:phosphatidylinositol glycan class N